jgi:hypothetical protein
MAARARTQTQDSRAAAATAGAGTGTLLVILANSLPESKWKHLAVGVAPALSVSMSSGLIWIRTRLEKRRGKKEREERLRKEEEDFARAKKTLEEGIQNPNTSEARRKLLQQDLEELEGFRKDRQLALVYKKKEEEIHRRVEV